MMPIIFHTKCKTINCAFWNCMMLYECIFSSDKIFHYMFPSIHATCNFYKFTPFSMNSNPSSTITTFQKFPVMIMQLLLLQNHSKKGKIIWVRSIYINPRCSRSGFSHVICWNPATKYSNDFKKHGWNQNADLIHRHQH
jgi:hypothetical protein